MKDYDDLFKAGNTAQLEKLKKNEHKKGYNKIDLFYACDRIEEERSELFDVLFNFRQTDIEKAKRAREEFADIANFAHMGIYACDNIISKEIVLPQNLGDKDFL